ncbi:hypothetical protein TomMM35A_33720 [Sphingobium sp. TomMM35A]
MGVFGVRKCAPENWAALAKPYPEQRIVRLMSGNGGNSVSRMTGSHNMLDIKPWLAGADLIGELSASHDQHRCFVRWAVTDSNEHPVKNRKSLHRPVSHL